MKTYSSFKVFSLLFGVAYVACFYLNSLYPASQWWALFRYYPSVSQFTFQRLPPSEAGPAILWYAWFGEAALVSAAVALITPRKVADALAPSLSWIVPTVVVVGILVYEKRWFF